MKNESTKLLALTLYESWKMIQFLDIEGQNVHNSGKRIIQLTPDVTLPFSFLFFFFSFSFY